MTTFQQARIDLGLRLRQLREAAKLSGKDLAARLQWQASKVSRLENARQTATEEDVLAWAEGVGAPADAVDQLLALAVALGVRQADWGQQDRGGMASIQEDIREMESKAKAMRVFEGGIVLGLLQTAEYARNVLLRLKHAFQTTEAVDSSVRVRMQRQEILYDPSRTFRFVMTEGALRTKMGPDHVMRGQYDRLLAVSTLPNVRLGIIPFEHDMPSAPITGFWMFDEEIVLVPTRTKEVRLTELHEIGFYSRLFEDYCKVAEFDEAGRAVIMRVLNGYGKQSPH
ncbi:MULTISPECIES: helix-turn-helix domain-containing protein [Nonomuraea]|uniref:Helix-turn-helix domain-containing protein n=1 Tax=Nonomuraea mangrovi TaxID=2316207 RepID=A0ABW4SX57_9ACTN